MQSDHDPYRSILDPMNVTEGFSEHTVDPNQICSSKLHKKNRFKIRASRQYVSKIS